MCQFKSFIYSVDKEQFFYSNSTESHTSIAYDFSCHDDRVIKFELLPKSNSWSFILDTIPENLAPEKIMRCFNILPTYIMQNIARWTTQAIERKCIKSKLIFDDLEKENDYYVMRQEYKKIESEISDINVDNIDADIKTLKQFPSTYKKEIASLQKKKNKLKSKLIELSLKRDYLLKDIDIFIKNYGHYENIYSLTLENITQQVDECFKKLNVKGF